MLEPDQIIAGIRSGQCKKVTVPEFANTSYFADCEGNVYSLNRPTEPKLIEPKLGNGLMWVTLFEQEGRLQKLMLGELIAHTFLPAINDDALTTVIYKDGDPNNNAADNLEWASAQDQQRLLRDKHLTGRSQDRGSSPSTLDAKARNVVDEVPFRAEPAKDPLLDQLHEIQRRLEFEERRSATLRDALAPFACFHLPPALATGTAGEKVLEANKSGNNHSVLTVQHFRVAKSAYQNREGQES